MNNPTKIVIHCSDIPTSVLNDQFNSINKYHRSQDFPVSTLGIHVGYHRLVTGGKNYKCREDLEIGAHCNTVVDGISMNEQSLGICWGGDGDLEYPDKQSYKLLKKQICEWQDIHNISDENVFFHRNFNTKKTCPGTLLDDSWLEKLIDTTHIRKPLEEKIKRENLLAQISLLERLLDALKKFWAIKV